MVQIERNAFPRYLSSTTTHIEKLSWGFSSSTILLTKLVNSIEESNTDVAWETLKDYKRLYGFPKKSILNRLLITLSYSSDHRSLTRAHDLVNEIVKEKSDLPHHGSLVRLSLALARAQIPVPASNILRVVVENDRFVSMDMWSAIFLHMVKTDIGSCLASGILIEICECFLQHHHKCTGNKMKKNVHRNKLLKPDTTLFNLVLSSCVEFGSIAKAHRIIHLMRLVGVVANADSINIIAHIYEMNGQRQDVLNLEEHVGSSSHRHYLQLYECLLNLHFKFNDIDAAANLMMDMHTGFKSCSVAVENHEMKMPQQVQVGSCNLMIGYRMLVEPNKFPNDFLFRPRKTFGLVVFKDGKLVPTRKAIAKLINASIRGDRIEELSDFLVDLIHVEKDNDLVSEVVESCIRLGWLEIAHDILDHFKLTKLPLINSSIYTYLYREYNKKNRAQEAKLVLRDMKQLNLPIEISTNLEKCYLSELMEKEMTKPIEAESLLYELNSSIFFFCKAKMMEDAMRTLRKMEARNIQPNSQTFIHLVNGYSSLEMYREITILWGGEIKRVMEGGGCMVANKDLLDCLLFNFIAGGYFERVMEVVSCMNGFNMYIDKWVYRREFLKRHRSLYKNLRTSETTSEVQKKRLDHVRTFRRWVGIDVKISSCLS